MTIRSKIRYALATALLAAAFSSQAQTPDILLPSPLPDSAPTGTGQDLLIDPFNSGPAPGLFLSIGSVSAGGASIYRLTPTDATSSTFALKPVDYGLSGAYRLAHRPGDGLYAVGHFNLTTGSRNRTSTVVTWKIRRSPDAGQGALETWEDDDVFQFSGTVKRTTTPFNSRAYGIATDKDGRVHGDPLVCGTANDGKVNHWIVRKRVGPKDWDTVLDRTTVDGYSIPYKMAYVPQWTAHFAVGIFNDRWTVLRSVDGGETWSPSSIDEGPEAGIVASAQDITSDSRGNIYVCGVRGRDGANRGWVLRVSNNGGDHWDTLLDQPSTTDSWAVRLSSDAADTISLAGAIDGANGSPRWAVVRNTPGQVWAGAPTASWENAIFPFGPDTSPVSKGRGMVTDALGNMFLTGDVIDWTDPDDGASYSGTRAGLLRWTAAQPEP